MKIAILCDNSAVGYWRIKLPFAATKHEVVEDPTEADVIVACRVTSESAMIELKQYGKPIIFDLDDDLWSIPDWNFAHKHYDQESLDDIAVSLKHVDHMTVSTEHLKGQVPFDGPITVIPNRINYMHYPEKGNKSMDGKVRILWCGSGSHVLDLDEIAPVLFKITDRYPQVLLQFMGYMSPKIVEHYKENKGRCNYTTFKESLGEYLEFSKRIMADIAIAPLNDCEFNRSKSNLKWLEYSACGIPVVASDVGPYKTIKHRSSGLLCANNKEWYSYLCHLIESKSARKKLVAGAQQELKRNYNITRSTKEWDLLIEEVGK